MASSRFISNFKNKKLQTSKCSISRCKICQKYSNETKKFTILNGPFWEIHREIDCHSCQSLMSWCPILIWNVKCVTEKKHILGKQWGQYEVI